MILYSILEFFKGRKNEDVPKIIQDECFHIMKKLDKIFCGKRLQSIQLSFCYIMARIIIKNCKKGMEDEAVNLLSKTIIGRVNELKIESLKDSANDG